MCGFRRIQDRDRGNGVIEKYYLRVFKGMWNVMVFDDETKSRPIKVMEFNTIKDMSRVLDLPPQVLSNYYHRLIRPRGPLKYIAMFKA